MVQHLHLHRQLMPFENVEVVIQIGLVVNLPQIVRSPLVVVGNLPLVTAAIDLLQSDAEVRNSFRVGMIAVTIAAPRPIVAMSARNLQT